MLARCLVKRLLLKKGSYKLERHLCWSSLKSRKNNGAEIEMLYHRRSALDCKKKIILLEYDRCFRTSAALWKDYDVTAPEFPDSIAEGTARLQKKVFKVEILIFRHINNLCI